MDDREKVMNALRRCESYGYCEDRDCPYYENTNCLEMLRKDALELLKEQENQIEQLEHDLAVAQNNLNYYVNGND